MRATSRFWNENEGHFCRRHFRFSIKMEEAVLQAKFISSDCMARKEQDEITVADVK